jgi:hypothetical protein
MYLCLFLFILNCRNVFELILADYETAEKRYICDLIN